MDIQPMFSGIICELNPLHNGHQRILREAAARRKPVVCVMSGNFVQRGETAVLDKWNRTRTALAAGADLVIELPLSFAAAGAERFATGGVALLQGLGGAGQLFFGSEWGQLPQLQTLAAFLCDHSVSPLLSDILKEGISFAAAREQLVLRELGPLYVDILREPNNILAVEYLKAIRRRRASLLPVPVRRLGTGHDRSEIMGRFASAGEIRRRMFAGEEIRALVPDSTMTVMDQAISAGQSPVSLRALERAMLSKFRQMSPADFQKLPEVGEGLEYRLYRAAGEAVGLDQFYALVKSKRYSHARIRRIALAGFLGISAQAPVPLYLKILGMSKTGEAFLRERSARRRSGPLQAQGKPAPERSERSGEIFFDTQEQPALQGPIERQPEKKSERQTEQNTLLPIVIRADQRNRLDPAAREMFHLESLADDQYALAMPIPRPAGMNQRSPVMKWGF